MKINEYSHRHGKEILSLTHLSEYTEILSILGDMPPYPHESWKNATPKDAIA